MWAKKSILFGIFFLLGFAFVACKEKKQAEVVNTKFRKFITKLDTLHLPYTLLSEAKNHAQFTAFINSKVEIDSAFAHELMLDSHSQETLVGDTTHEDQSRQHHYYYHIIGFLPYKNKYILLYGRNTKEAHDDIHVFMATYSVDGSKNSEIIFHKPLLDIMPTELRRASTVKADTTVVLSKIKVEHEFVNGIEDVMKPIHKVEYDYYYLIDNQGNILQGKHNKHEIKD
jgi:hypothetical protein